MSKSGGHYILASHHSKFCGDLSPPVPQGERLCVELIFICHENEQKTRTK